jgi:hypothetical protein
MPLIERCYAINRSSNSVYYSDDFGDTWTEVSSNVSTTSASDVGANPYYFNELLVLNGANAATTPYFSQDGAVTFVSSSNIAGKEIMYASDNVVVAAGKRLKTNTGPTLYISYDNGNSFTTSVDTTSLFSFPGASYSNITLMSAYFSSQAGGYIAIAGNGDNSNADQILARSYNQGADFPDSIVLDGNIYGVIRCVINNDAGQVIFAAGEPGQAGRGKLYTINHALTDIPVEVLPSATVGDNTNATITKFFQIFGDNNIIFFIDSTGDLYKSSNKGLAWTFMSNVPGNCVDIVAANESILIALTSSPNAIQKSVDGGLTWTEILQPTWNNPEALAFNIDTNCRECRLGEILGYVSLGSGNREYCISASYSGPICKPPYVYDSIDEVCAVPANVRPTNLIYSIDQSGSIDGDENLLFKAFINRVTASLADRLVIGSIEIAVVKWAESACVVQDFTTDINEINSSVLDDNNIGVCAGSSTTNHVDAFCVSTRLMYEKSLLRPDAENVMEIFTDGTNNVKSACNLTDIGLNPIIYDTTDNDAIFYTLAEDAKQNLAGKGMKIFIVAVGDIANIANLYSGFVANGLQLGYPPYPSISPAGNYYFYRGGDFDTIDSIANQIRLGLGASTYVPVRCPEGCVGVAGLDGLGYCECINAVLSKLCVYKLTDCQGIQPTIYTTEDDFRYYVPDFFDAQYPNRVITLKNPPSPGYYYQPGCYTVLVATDQELASLLPEDIVPAEVFQAFLTCPDCLTPDYYKFTDCSDPTRFIYTSDDCSFRFQNYGNVWKTTKQPYDDGTCWFGEFVGPIENASPVVANWQQAVPFQTMFFSCLECAPVDVPSYRLSDTCENNLPDIYTDRDFSAYVGQVVKVLQYPDVCWACSLNQDSNVTFEILSPDGVPYGTCQECLPVAAVTYTLRDCNDQFNTIVTDSNLNQYLGGVVRLTTTGDICWQVFPGSSPADVPQPVSVSQSFADCGECSPQIFTFINCQNEDNVLYTLLDFSAYIDQVVNLQEYPGVCWTVRVYDGVNVPLENVTIQGDPYAGCPECLTTYYQLTNCANPDVFLISTSTELSRYVGRTITAAGYTGLCFTVTSPQCNCIRATINGVEYDAYAESTQFNGRNVYYITTDSGDELAIAWSVNPNQWELFERSTSETLGFHTINSDCPFSNLWTIIQGSPYIITTVTFCADRIYNIAPELEFADCEPCINCI